MTTRIAASLAAALLASQPALAGDVAVTVQGETLVLRGDDLGDLVLAPPVGVGSATVVVTPQGTTTVNGTATAASFAPIPMAERTSGRSR